MPTYDYRCLKCGKVFEAFQKISDKPLEKCIYCKGKVERLISSGSGIIFKGSGFYETDYKQKNRRTTSGNDQQCKKCSDNNCDLKKDK
ncbi:MAG: zinc ribbon domain-containing protein [Candidatus Omnitrophica bacterium]|nr:zinc ribbon domain-containing protein [Candidatus Omnitrophota bacterium]MCF7893870.1 zinc ribbon domain-containing protein [Candidatus Omnitrophota bacterium]